MKQNSSIPLLSVLLLSLLIAGSNAIGGMVGGWKPIEDLNDPHVVEIGQYAVSEYDSRSKANLKFVSVVSGETQVVSGANYKLVLTAKDGSGAISKYEAIVWEKTWLKFRKLTSFKHL